MFSYLHDVCMKLLMMKGLMGSVEYIESYAHALSAQAIMYLNLDVAVDGNELFTVSGSPHAYVSCCVSVSVCANSREVIAARLCR